MKKLMLAAVLALLSPALIPQDADAGLRHRNGGARIERRQGGHRHERGTAVVRIRGGHRGCSACGR